MARRAAAHRFPMPAALAVGIWQLVASAPVCAQAAAQHPSPMVETTRPHPRIEHRAPAGRREPLSVGTLYLSPGFTRGAPVPLVVHFHGAAWLVEQYVARVLPRAALVTMQLGAGSRVYGERFVGRDSFASLVAEVEGTIHRLTGHEVRVGNILLSSFSAGYGATRAILRHQRDYDRVGGVLLADGLHASYVAGTAPPRTGDAAPEVVVGDLEVLARFATDAAAGRKRMWVTHSEVFPGTYASTTETADYLLDRVGARRTPVLQAGPIGMQQLSAVEDGGLRLWGFAGNSARDHLDHLYALGAWLERVKPWLMDGARALLGGSLHPHP